MKKSVLLTFIAIFAVQVAIAQHPIIPEPVNYIAASGSFVLKDPVVFVLQDDPEVKQYVAQFQELLKHAGVSSTLQSTKPKKAGNAIVITLNEQPAQELGKEGYTLEVDEGAITLAANEAPGIFYGLQTLKQLLPPQLKPDQVIRIPACQIRDYPRFGWRGLMLDVSRHFFTVDEVKAYVDKMAQYKFNIFHWHLTDDEGWRIEIKSLPKLTAVGAWRVERHGRFGSERPYPKAGEEPTYGGFYTQEEIREVVSYAADRNITIVPEVDMPGHSMSALAAYPELSVGDEEKFVNPGAAFSEWYGGGEFKMLIENTLDPTDEKVYEFVDKVFSEVAALFPGEYIHMGGDEAYHGYWEEDAGVREFMEANGLENTHKLQSYFVKRIEKIISSTGKKMIGWDEILEGGLANGAAVMSWRGMAGGIEAVNMGHKVVMSPTTYAYLDYTQGDRSIENKIYADLSLEKAYRFNPVPDEISNPELILGGQANLWTEAIPTLPFAFYMTYPRAFATAESLWSPEDKKNWDSFIRRTEDHFARFDAENTNISKAVYEPIVKVYREGEKLMCQLTNSVPGTEIYYTINNTYPAAFGKLYTGPFEIPKGDLSLRTQTLRAGTPLGRELMIHRTELEGRLRDE